MADFSLISSTSYVSGFYNFKRDIPQRLTSGSFIHPVTGELINKSIENLEQDAVNDSVKFIQAVETGDKEAFLRVVPNFNLDSGTINGQPIRKKPTQEDFASIQGETDKNEDTSNNILNSIINFIYKNRRK